MRVNLQYHAERKSGYGRMGYEIVRSLKKFGVEECGRLDGLRGKDIPGGNFPMSRLDDGPETVSPVALWLSTPPSAKRWYVGQHASILTMWESTQMPAGFREGIENFDRIFVPSDQNVELFSQYHPDVRKVPLGIDPVAWGYKERHAVDRDFNFITAGYGPRKNVKEVSEAFQIAFPGGRPIGSGPVPHLYCRSRDNVGGPNVHLISSAITEEEEISLYAQAHCYVSGSRGEGWGLMPLQAIAQGCPTILADAHGHHEFAHLGIGIGWDPISAAGATFWGDGGEWWEPKIDEMVEAMRYVYENHEQAFKNAASSSQAALATYTWDNCAQELIFNLPEMFNDGPTERVWHKQDLSYYRVLVNPGTPPYVVNGVVHHFKPGVEYWETFDIKRQMTVNGHLDLSCFDVSEMGVPAAMVDIYRSQNERCAHCHQRFNSDPSLLANLLEV